MMILSSSQFQKDGEIPKKYTGDGEGISPPLAWSQVPDNAESLVLIVDDADAVEEVRDELTGKVTGYRPHKDRPWVHWVLYNIPPSARELPEGGAGFQLPAGTLEGVNGRKETGYTPPWPPRPTGPHHYFFRLYALDLVIPDLETVKRALGPETVRSLGNPSGLSNAVFQRYTAYLRAQRIHAVHPSRIIARDTLVGTYQGSE